MAKSLASQSDWPEGHTILSPYFLKVQQERLPLLRSKFRSFILNLDPNVGFDMDWLICEVCEDAYLVILLIAEEEPPVDPVDPTLVAEVRALDSQLQAINGDHKPLDLSLLIPALPHPGWDFIFRGYCELLASCVDAYIYGDSPIFTAIYREDSSPDLVFRVLRGLIAEFNNFPFLRPYVDRLLRKLDATRTGVALNKYSTEHAKPKSGLRPKRKIGTPDLDGMAQLSLESPRSKKPKFDNSGPPTPPQEIRQSFWD
ncbi:hypothetical protein F5B22DRAFT_648661 [Xylaria bambusicola]|uniref:uncharacterized protein n=1 Tax=Xylaria bambusicola TaxID=326684 RepID=UPI0020077DAF|nr:uncharacterized protein F5B22DRAFT_648661 [Xylaria bambusicola]KAI0512557.1 hypothetical protein F5B22DRAFT_648661 [Xylaria bambusicola]